MLQASAKGHKSGTIKVTGCGITGICVLPAKYTRVHSLFVGFNRITSLENIGQFQALDALYAEGNQIERIEDIEPLKDCRSLTKLSLSSNPVCKLPLFFAHIIRICPSVRFVDGKPVEEMLQSGFTKAQFFGLLEFERNLFGCIGASLAVKRALKLSSLFPDVSPNSALELAKQQCDDILVHGTRESCVGMSAPQYCLFLKERNVDIQRKIISFGQKMEIDIHIVGTHSRILRSAIKAPSIEDYLDILPKLVQSANRFITQTSDFSESLVIAENLSSEKATATSDTFPPLQHKEREPAPHQHQQFQDESSEASFDDVSDRRAPNNDTTDNDPASDEEKPTVAGADGISDEIVQSVAVISEVYPTESERTHAVTFSKDDIGAHKDGLLFDASQGETMTEPPSASNKGEQDLSDASDFDVQQSVKIDQKALIPRPREPILAVSSEMFASRGESMDSMQGCSRIVGAPTESACSDFEKVEIVQKVPVRPSFLSKTKNDDFEASRGESMEMFDGHFGGNDSDSMSAFPQSRTITFLPNLNRFFKKWKLRFLKRKPDDSSDIDQIRQYIERCELRAKIEKQKSINFASRRNKSNIMRSIEEMKQSSNHVSSFQSKTKTQATMVNSLSPGKNMAKSVMKASTFSPNKSKSPVQHKNRE